MRFLLAKRAAALVAVAVAVSLAGCGGGSTGKVGGRVLVDGEPMGGFEVNFISVEDGSGAIGSAGEGGRFELFQGRGNDQIPIGDYKVTVAPTSFIDGIKKPKVSLGKQYTDASQATVIKTVEPGTNDIDIEIETK